jgi:hypothetical protein
MSLTCKTDERGTKRWYKDGIIHRDNDLPAKEYQSGTRLWFQHGKPHRDGDRPAKESYLNGGYSVWYRHGKLHRNGLLPAIETARGTNSWYKYNQRYTYKKLINYYSVLTRFGRMAIMKIKLMRLKRIRWIHGELLCKPPVGNYDGGTRLSTNGGLF